MTAALVHIVCGIDRLNAFNDFYEDEDYKTDGFDLIILIFAIFANP